MATNCARLIADLFLNWNKSQFMPKHHKDPSWADLQILQYLDDIFSVNNADFYKYITENN